MFDSVSAIHTQSCNIKSIERIEKGVSIAQSFIKLNYSPRKIYFHSADKGVELLWVEGENKGNALVHSKSFPLVNFDLDPYGSLLRKNQHHTIFDLGSAYIGVMIANTILGAPKDFNKHFSYAGTVTWDKRECYRIIIDYPEYNYIDYIVQEGETVTSISKKFNTSDYKIRYANNLSSYYGIVKPGLKLKIPVPYSNKVILLIDKKQYIPLHVTVYDEKGLYESYEFTNMQINHPFKSDEFSKTFKDYSF
jgi:hypothetical protein